MGMKRIQSLSPLGGPTLSQPQGRGTGWLRGAENGTWSISLIEGARSDLAPGGETGWLGEHYPTSSAKRWRIKWATETEPFTLA